MIIRVVGSLAEPGLDLRISSSALSVCLCLGAYIAPDVELFAETMGSIQVLESATCFTFVNNVADSILPGEYLVAMQHALREP